jgi:hypothetical protein
LKKKGKAVFTEEFDKEFKGWGDFQEKQQEVK